MDKYVRKEHSGVFSNPCTSPPVIADIDSRSRIGFLVTILAADM